MERTQKIEKLESIIESIQELDESFVSDGVSSHFLQLFYSNEEIQVNGNFEGLVHLALKILETATNVTDGSHVHFDKNSVMDECTFPLVISYKSAEWDH